jgi:hypothetical protein
MGSSEPEKGNVVVKNRAENFRSKGAPRCVRRSRQRNRDDELTALEFHLPALRAGALSLRPQRAGQS